MAEQFLNVPKVLAVLDQPGGRCMPYGMRPLVFDTGFFQQALVLPVEVPRPDPLSVLAAKDQVLIMVGGAEE
jgi:hypothetical protein